MDIPTGTTSEVPGDGKEMVRMVERVQDTMIIRRQRETLTAVTVDIQNGTMETDRVTGITQISTTITLKGGIPTTEATAPTTGTQSAVLWVTLLMFIADRLITEMPTEGTTENNGEDTTRPDHNIMSPIPAHQNQTLRPTLLVVCSNIRKTISYK